MGVVGNAIGDIGHLGFQGREPVSVQGDEGVFFIPGMLADAFQDFPGKVEAVEFRVAFFQKFDNAQALFVVLEPPVAPHELVEHGLARVAEGRVPQVVRQGNGFRQVFIQLQGFADRPGDLGHLQGMGQAGPVIIPLMVDEHLSLVFQTPESGGVDHPVAVALKPGSVRMFLFLVLSPPAFPAFYRIGGQGRLFDFFNILPFDQGSGCVQGSKKPILNHSTANSNREVEGPGGPFLRPPRGEAPHRILKTLGEKIKKLNPRRRGRI